MSDGYLKMRCPHCDAGLSFPPHGVGVVIDCPGCRGSVTLKPVPPEQQQDSSGSALSSAELLLLSKFASAGELAHLGNPDRWTAVLPAHPAEVVERFLQRGLLERVSPDLVSLLCFKSGNELKALAKERGLGQSGTKPVIAKRLAKAAPEAMARLFAGKTYLCCTPKGAELAQGFLDAGKLAEQRAKEQSLAAIKQRRFKDACLIVARFEASQVFPRGLGVDWQSASEHPCETDISALRAIFSERLSRHVQFNEATIEQFRVAAAMMQLWGNGRAKPYLQSMEEQIDWELECRMVLFRGISVARVAQMREFGIKRVECLGANCPEDCPTCRAANGKVFPIDSAPVIPHEGCTCEVGCRCMVVAAQ